MQVIDKRGTIIEVDPLQVPRLLASGEFGLRPGTYTVLDSTGRQKATVPENQVIDALRKGWHLETPKESRDAEIREKHGGALGLIGAASKGVLKGFSMGLSDIALSKIVETGITRRTPEELAALETLHPTASFTGELAGMGLGLLTPLGWLGAAAKAGGAARGAVLGSRVARAAKAVAPLTTPVKATARLGSITAEGAENMALRALTKRGIKSEALKKTLAKATGLGSAGAVEGGLWGGAHTISEVALGDPESVAETIVANVGAGALFGAGIGGSVGALAGVGKNSVGFLARLAKGRMSGPTTEATQQKAIHNVFTAIGVSEKNTEKLIKRKGRDWARQSVHDILYAEDVMPPGIPGPVVLNTSNMEEIAKRMSSAVEYHGAKMGGIQQNLDAIAEQLDSVVVIPSKPGVRAKAVIPYGAWLRPERLISGTVDEATATGKKIFDARETLPSPLKIRAQLEKNIKIWRNRIGHKGAVKSAQEALNILRKRGNMWTFKQAQEFMNEIPKTWTRKPVDTGTAEWGHRELWRMVRDELDKKVEVFTSKANRPDVLRDYRRSRQVYASLRDISRHSEDTAIKQAGESFTKSFMEHFSRSFAWRIGWTIAKGAAGIPSALKGAALGGGARTGMDILKKQIYPAGKQAQLAAKAGTLGRLQMLTDTTQSKVDKALDLFFEVEKIPKAAIPVSISIFKDITKKKDKYDAYWDFREKLDKYSTDTTYLLGTLAAHTAPIQAFAPTINTHTIATMGRILQQIRGRVPRRYNHGPLQPLYHEEPTEQELYDFGYYVAGKLDPLGTISRIATGNAAAIEVQAFREAYPKLAERTGLRILSMAAEQRKQIPYAVKLQIGQLIGAPVDPSMRPDFIARSQQALVPQQTRQGRRSKELSEMGDEYRFAPHKSGGLRQ